MTWRSTDELLSSIRDATDRLVSGKAPVDEAHAEARLLSVASKVIAIRLDHARMTGRLMQGSPELPDMMMLSDAKMEKQ